MKLPLNTLTRIGIVAVTLVATNLAFAEPGNDTNQPHGKPPKSEKGKMDPEKRMARMSEELGLTPEQKANMKSIMEDTAFARQQIESNSSLSPDERREKMREVRTTTRTRMDSILTPEQKAKRDEMREHSPKEKGPKPDKKSKEKKKDKSE